MTVDTPRLKRPTPKTNMKSYFVAPIVAPIILILVLIVATIYTD